MLEHVSERIRTTFTCSCSRKFWQAWGKVLISAQYLKFRSAIFAILNYVDVINCSSLSWLSNFVKFTLGVLQSQKKKSFQIHPYPSLSSAQSSQTIIKKSKHNARNEIFHLVSFNPIIIFWLRTIVFSLRFDTSVRIKISSTHRTRGQERRECARIVDDHWKSSHMWEETTSNNNDAMSATNHDMEEFVEELEKNSKKRRNRKDFTTFRECCVWWKRMDRCISEPIETAKITMSNKIWKGCKWYRRERMMPFPLPWNVEGIRERKKGISCCF